MEFSGFVETQLGLYFPRERWSDLSRAVRSAAGELGFASAAECVRWFLETPRSPQQVELLAAHLTIGETYFFRDPLAFAALEQRVLPEIVRARQGRANRLRIWSAGCCTGEEAYSIAISVSRVLPLSDGWQVTVLGTDINPRFLHKAAVGIYSRWSFRGVNEQVLRDYFREVTPGQFEIAPRIKRLVTFTCLNLVEDAYPSLATNTNAMDVIFCRNVLMYFSRDKAKRVLGALNQALVDGGWFFASPAEVGPDLFAGFASGQIPSVTVYRKSDAAAAAPVPETRAHAPRTKPAAAPVPARVAAAKPAAPKPQPPAQHAPNARRLADEGRLAEALRECDRAISADKLNAANHYLRGVILQEQGAFDDAVAAFRRALFLERDFVVAHFAMGNLLVRLRRVREAGRSFENARALLRHYSAEAVLPEADGITAGRLLAILESMQEVTA